MTKPLPRTQAILHPIRARILVTLSGRPLTPRQIAALMEEVPLGTVYRHLNILLEAGLIEVVRERRVHGTVERQFAVVEAAAFLDKTDREKLTAEDIVGLVSALTGVVQSAFHRYVRASPLPPPEGEIAFLVKSLYLTPEEYNDLRQTIIVLLAKARHEPHNDARRRLVGYFSVPDPDQEPPADTDDPF